VGGVPSPLCPQAWEALIPQTDPDRDFLINGVTNGFKLFDEDPADLNYECANYASAEGQPAKAKLDHLYRAELEEQKISKVFNKPKCVHAIGAVPRKDRNDPRPITDCSRPYDGSINDYMFPEKFRYNTVDSAAKLVTPGAWLSIIDIRHAYRSCPVFPPHRTYTGFKWKFSDNVSTQYQYFVDNFLCFGLRAAPSIFVRISNAIARIFKTEIDHPDVHLVNYLDDFCIVAKTKEMCLIGQRCLIRVLRQLGFDISWSKVEGPSQALKFLGIIIDSDAMELRLPEDKILKLKSELQKFATKKSATKRELQSLAGSMSFASAVIKGGRTFSRRVIDLINKLKHPYHKTRLTSDFRRDIVSWWLPFMQQFNGKAKILDNKPVPMKMMQCDASLKGYGVYFNGHFMAGSWNGTQPPVPASLCQLPNWQDVFVNSDSITNINHLELLTALLAARHFGYMWRNKKVVIYTDNTQALANINKGSNRNPVVMMWLRELFWLSAQFNFHITARYISTKQNWISDGLSRLATPGQWERLVSQLSQQSLPLYFR